MPPQHVFPVLRPASCCKGWSVIMTTQHRRCESRSPSKMQRLSIKLEAVSFTSCQFYRGWHLRRCSGKQRNLFATNSLKGSWMEICCTWSLAQCRRGTSKRWGASGQIVFFLFVAGFDRACSLICLQHELGSVFLSCALRLQCWWLQAPIFFLYSPFLPLHSTFLIFLFYHWDVCKSVTPISVCFPGLLWTRLRLLSRTQKMRRMPNLPGTCARPTWSKLWQKFRRTWRFCRSISALQKTEERKSTHLIWSTFGTGSSPPVYIVFFFKYTVHTVHAHEMLRCSIF